MPMHVSNLGPYPDWLAFSLTIFIASFLVIGVKESSLVNSAATILNLGLIIFIFVVGATKINFDNWKTHVDVNKQ